MFPTVVTYLAALAIPGCSAYAIAFRGHRKYDPYSPWNYQLGGTGMCHLGNAGGYQSYSIILLAAPVLLTATVFLAAFFAGLDSIVPSSDFDSASQLATVVSMAAAGLGTWVGKLARQASPEQLAYGHWLDQIKVGDTVSGVVARVVDEGAFVELDDGLHAAIAIDQQFGIAGELKPGDKVTAKVIKGRRSADGGVLTLSMQD